MFLIFCAILLAIAIHLYLIKPLRYWERKNVQQYNLLTALKEYIFGFYPQSPISDTVFRVYNDFPDNRYAGMYQFSNPMLNIRDPDLIKQVTVKDFDHFVDHPQFFSDDVEPLWEKNLLSLRGDKWREMRATLSPSFTSSKMKIMFELISDCASQFVNYFEAHDTEIVSIEMKDTCTRYTNDVIASAAFGYNCDSLQQRENQFYLMGKEATNVDGILKLLKFILVIFAPSLAKKLGFTVISKNSAEFFKKVVKENIREREEKGIVRPDMIQLLMEARKNRDTANETEEEKQEEAKDEGFSVVQEELVVRDGQKRRKERLTDMDITAQAFIFFFAGFETVSQLMCFMAYEIALQPDIQKRLQEEVDETRNQCKGKLTYEAVTKMKYMDMVISETLRKWPAIAILDRICVKPYTIEPVKANERPVNLKVGDGIGVAVYAIQRDPKYYPDPERFDPERFNDENKHNIQPYTYLPFGTGPRNCIGSRFALLETKTVFYHILSKFEIVVTEKTKIPLKFVSASFTLTVDGGLWLGLKKRRLTD